MHVLFKLRKISQFISLAVHSFSQIPPPVLSLDLCLGQQPGQSQPASVSALLQELSTRYCGCSRVLGNVIVSLGSLAANGISSENFTFLSNIVEITGYLEISGLILSDRIILPELKVIQGRALRNGRGLFVANVTAPVGVLMPKLSEVVRGDAYFSGVTGQCSYSTVNWNDVLNSGKLVTGSTASCEGEHICTYLCAHVSVHLCGGNLYHFISTTLS